VPFHDGPRDALDGDPVADIADLVLGADLLRDRSQRLGTTGEQNAAPTAGGQQSRRRGPDSARPSGDYGDANVRIVSTLIATVSSIGSA
jgi:hypothetical protein